MSAVEHETLCQDGREVTLQRGGAGAPLVLLHDVFGARWDGLAARLARNRTVVLPSLAGFPGSAYREDLDTIEDLPVIANLEVLERLLREEAG